jgi:hypothetical protein
MHEMLGLGRQMRKFLIDRKIGIDAAHRVHLHGSKCGQLHGHRYSVHAVCSGSLAEGGEEDSMVMDFGFLKDEMISVIDNCCDHGPILSEKDPLLKMLLKDCKHHPIIEPSGFNLTPNSIVRDVSGPHMGNSGLKWSLVRKSSACRPQVGFIQLAPSCIGAVTSRIFSASR